MADYNAITQALVSHYFNAFDNFASRSSLASIYRPESTLSWEGTQLTGAESIINHLTRPELENVKTKVTSIDSQPGSNESITILVTGSLAIDNAYDKLLNFSRVFILNPIPGQPGGFFIYNDIFRLIL